MEDNQTPTNQARKSPAPGVKEQTIAKTDFLLADILGQLARAQGTLDGFLLRGFLGSSNQAPLEFQAGGSRVQRFEPSSVSPNVIAGHPGNAATAGVRGATIAGGGACFRITLQSAANTLAGQHANA